MSPIRSIVRVLLPKVSEHAGCSVNPTLRGIVYVSIWVVIWGTVASLMDWMLLVGEVYESGTAAQAVTFIAYGAATVVLATRFSDRFLAGSDETAADKE